jgi:hypothetical protein
MRSTLFFAAVLVTIGLILPGCGGDSEDASTDTTSTASEPIPFEKEGNLAVLSEGDTLVTLQIEIADTDSSRERGMMGRESFPDPTSGMLFVFDDERPRSFWMANTPLSLDLFFINADSTVVNVAKYAKPYSPDPVQSDGPAQFVLETPAGFADTYGVVSGDRVRWTEDEG